MAGEIAVMSEFAEKVKEKIKRDFGSLIPEEAWDQLVKKAVEDFIKNDLGKVVKAELETEVKKRMGYLFNSPEWLGQWDSNSGNNIPSASVMAKKIISENIPQIMEAILGRAIQGIVEQVRNRF